VKVLIVSLCEKKLSDSEFVLPIERIIKEKFPKSVAIKKSYKEVNSKDIISVDKVIVSGNPLMDNFFAANVDELHWVRESNKPILGICAGMQAVALAFGLKLEKSKEIGLVDVKLVKKNPLFSSDISAYSIHSMAVNEKLGGFEVLARSKNCIHALKHQKKDIYAVLFHPEVRNPDIIKRFLEL
jgi:GMP synthase-like glutamine amidotransferase